MNATRRVREEFGPKERKFILFVELPCIRQSLVSNYDLFSIPVSVEGAVGFRKTGMRSRREYQGLRRKKTPGLSVETARPPSRGYESVAGVGRVEGG